MDTIEKLIEKIPMCNEQSLQEWWGSSVTDSLPKPPSLVQWDDDGCFLINLHSITYCNFSIGRTQRLTKKINPSNWDLLQKLYIKGSETKLFRIDLPVKRTVIDIEGTPWEYTETVRPGRGNGEIVFKVYETIDSTEQEVEGMFNIIKAAAELSPKIPLFKFSLLRHDDAGFYFYSDWGDWEYDVSFVVEYNLQHIKNYLSPSFKNWEYPDHMFSIMSQKWRSL